MVDHVSPEIRSRIMGRVRGKDTQPEMRVRHLVSGMGFRYRLHRRELPGKPDLTFPGRRKVIFVHGCFWHQHDCVRGARPSSNRNFWNAKLDRTIQRDVDNISALEDSGWSVLVVWECETKDLERLGGRIKEFLEPAEPCLC